MYTCTYTGLTQFVILIQFNRIINCTPYVMISSRDLRMLWLCLALIYMTPKCHQTI